MAGSVPDPAEESAMLDRLLTRLALTEEDKLEKVLSKLLTVAIKNLGSPHATTKQKVMEMLSHINKRVRDQKQILLPLSDLVALYRAPDSHPMVKNFALVYLEMAFDRAPIDQKNEITPLLLDNISSRQSHHQDMLLRMAVKGLGKYGGARGCMENDLDVKYGFLKNDKDRELWMEFVLESVLYQPPGLVEGQLVAPPGLSMQQALRVSGKQSLSGEELATQKLALINFLGALDLPPSTLYPIFLVASVDSHFKVSRRGDELFKKKAAHADLEDAKLIRRLFSIFQGSPSTSTLPADAKIAPASPTLKARLMGAFTRSIAAANAFPFTLQCVFDCVYGEKTTMKLKQAGMEFAVWIFKHASDEQLKPMAPVIYKGLLKLLDDGSPIEGDNTVKQLRGFTFQAIGQLAQRAPNLFKDDIVVASRFFAALREESSTIKYTVQEAVTALGTAYEGCSGEVSVYLEALLLENAQQKDDASRFVALQWAARLFGFNHPASRYICMLAAGDNKLEIKELAERGLKPPKENPSAAYPSLSSMMAFICKQAPGVHKPSEISEQALLFQPKTYTAMIRFLRKCRSKGLKGGLGTDDGGAEGAYKMLLEHAISRDGTSELHATAADALLETASEKPDVFASSYGPRLSWLRQHSGHVDSGVRENISKLIGVAISAVEPATATTLLQELAKSFEVGVKGRYEDVDGSIRSAGYVLAQSMTSTPQVESALCESTASALCLALKNSSSGLAASAAEALGHVGLRGPLPLPPGELLEPATSAPAAPTSATASATSAGAAATSASAKDAGASSAANGKKDEDEKPTRALVMKRLVEMLKDKDVKAVQSSAKALGHVSHGDHSPLISQTALSGLFTLFQTKHEDTLFSVGESLAFIWGGIPITADKILKSNFISLAVSSNFLVSGSVGSTDAEMAEAGAESDEKIRDEIVRKLFDEFLFSGRKEERRAGAVALLSLVSYCGRQARIQSMLPEIQEAFSHLLGDADELTQEMASRGMSTVYELGDAETKEKLVQALVGTLSGTAKRKRAIKVTGETEVFQEGTLGETPDGKGVNTYKELCAIANEMGQPDLIYRFMDLANYQAGLASRRGAAFGFAGIAQKAGDALAPHMAALVPKLYRMQYDPNQGIRDAMNHIWKAVVPDPKKTVDEHFSAIMDDSLTQIGSRLWRSREAASLALSDLLQGRRWPEVKPYLEKIWTMAYRALDDIKETVRVAATTLTRTLTSLSARLCDPTLTPEAEAREAMSVVLPFQLTKGISSSVSEVRRLALNTVTKLVKQATPAVIRPHIPELVACMLEGLSNLEDSRLNYLQLHVEKMDTSAAERLESARVSATRDSPMWETLDFCLRQVDGSAMEGLTPKLTQLVRSGVGLNTRAGTAKFIYNLAQRTNVEILRPHSSAFLKVLFPVVRTEKSAPVRKALAAAAAAMAKAATSARLSKLIADSARLYDEPGDLEARMASALMLKEMSRQASDALRDHQTDVLPLAYVAKFDEDKDVKSIFGEVWDDNTSSAATSARLFLREIVERVLAGLQSSSWPRKQQSAKAISALSEDIGEDLKDHKDAVLKALLSELPGRLWEGKESVLEAIGAVAKASPKAFLAEGSTVRPEELVDAVVAACQRKKSAFREAALKCLDQVLKAFSERDLFGKVSGILLEACTRAPALPKPTGDAPSAPPSAPEESDKVPPLPLGLALGCLGAAWEGATSATVEQQWGQVAGALLVALSSDRPWTARAAGLSTAKVFVKRLKDAKTGSAHLQLLVPRILECTQDLKYSQVRVAALECLAEVIAVTCKGEGTSKELWSAIEARLTEMAEADKNAEVRALAIRTKDALKASGPTPMEM